MVKITKVEAFAGREGVLWVEDVGHKDYLVGRLNSIIKGDLGGGIAITFDNGMKLLIGNEDGTEQSIEVKLLDADGEALPVGRMSWSDTYHFTVPDR